MNFPAAFKTRNFKNAPNDVFNIRDRTLNATPLLLWRFAFCYWHSGYFRSGGR